MNKLKQTVRLNEDNFLDYLPLDYAEKLVRGFVADDGGIDRNSKVVTQFLLWVERESGRSSDVHFEMTRDDAAVILELLATD